MKSFNVQSSGLAILALLALASASIAEEGFIKSYGRTLSVSDAKKLASQRNVKSIEFPELTELTPEAAAQLASSDGWLRFEDVQSIDLATAEALAEHKGGLSIGLTQIPDDVARALARHKGLVDLHGPIFKNPLDTRTIASLTSAELANKLLESRKSLYLHIGRISPEVEEAFANFQGELHLDRLAVLTKPALARKLVESEKYGGLAFNELTVISPEVAVELASAGRDLQLNGLTELSVPVAESLTKSGRLYTLHLNGLTQLSVPAAQAIAKVGGLHLNGLAELPDEVAAALGSNKSQLRLNRVSRLSDAACVALSSHSGALFLEGLKEVSENGIIALAKIRGDLHLGVESLSDAAAQALAARTAGGELKAVKELSGEAAESLLRSRMRCPDWVKQRVAADTVAPAISFRTQVTATRFSHKGELFAVGCFDGTVFVGDSATGRKAFYLDVAGTPNYISGLSFVNDGAGLLVTAAGLRNGAAWLINVNNERLAKFGDGGAVQCMAVDSREQRVVLVSQGPGRCEIDVFPLANSAGVPVMSRKVDSETFWCVGFSPDGTAVVGAGRAKAYVWNVTNRGEQQVTIGGAGGMTAACVSQAASCLICGFADGGVTSVPITKENRLEVSQGAVFKGLRGKVNAVGVSPDGKWLAAGDDENRIIVWKVADQSVVKRSGRLAAAVRCLSFSPSAKVLGVGTGDLGKNKADDSGPFYMLEF